MERNRALAEVLRQSGFRATRGRVKLLRLVADLDHPTFEELNADLDAEGYALTTLYRGLEALEDAGLIRSVLLPHRGRVVHPADCAPHAHVVCRHCGAYRAAPLSRVDTGAALIPADGFSVEQVEITAVGTCAGCGPAAGQEAARTDASS